MTITPIKMTGVEKPPYSNNRPPSEGPISMPKVPEDSSHAYSGSCFNQATKIVLLTKIEDERSLKCVRRMDMSATIESAAPAAWKILMVTAAARNGIPGGRNVVQAKANDPTPTMNCPRTRHVLGPRRGTMRAAGALITSWPKE